MVVEALCQKQDLTSNQFLIEDQLLACESKSCSVVSESLLPHGLYSPWNSPGQNMEWVAVPCSRGSSQSRYRTQVPHCRGILYQLNHKESPRILERVAYPFSSGSFQPRNWTRLSCIAGGFFTNWAIRDLHAEYKDSVSIFWEVVLLKGR